MIYNFDEYKEYVDSITRQFPLLKTEQLVKIISVNKTIKQSTAFDILLALQRNGYILLSKDGWAMTKGMYFSITKGKIPTFFDNLIDNMFRLDEMENQIPNKLKKIVYAMWLVIDNMPDVDNLTIPSSPWTLMFTKKATDKLPSRLFEIVYFSKGEEILIAELIKATSKIKSEDLKKSIRRVAILEDENSAYLVPYLGFNSICVMNKSDTHFKVIEKRGVEDRWKDEFI